MNLLNNPGMCLEVQDILIGFFSYKNCGFSFRYVFVICLSFLYNLWTSSEHVPDFFYKDADFNNVNLTEILKKSKSEEMFQFIDVYAGGGYTLTTICITFFAYFFFLLYFGVVLLFQSVFFFFWFRCHLSFYQFICPKMNYVTK